ncbi:MAG: KamA family radical SAM protein [Proteobacteria bacterium]|nr:KamA family radical SAM protein [Pseudomonadota bacterium]
MAHVVLSIPKKNKPPHRETWGSQGGESESQIPDASDFDPLSGPSFSRSRLLRFSGPEPDETSDFGDISDAIVGPLTNSFRQRFYSRITDAQWNDWRWQIKNAITDARALERFVRLSPAERLFFQQFVHKRPVSITPYYMSLIDGDNQTQALRRCVVPTSWESVLAPGEAVDPLGEEADMVAPGLVHRYPDRVLLLATNACSTYCRYCTRHRVLSGVHQESRYNKRNLEKALTYIRKHKAIRDVLISGGDPLLLSDERLEYIVRELRRIDHVELIRIGTKVPAVLPQRVTDDLVKMLRRYHPLFMSLHFIHPDELTPEAGQACGRLSDAGIPLGSQTVLLQGINDDAAILKSLFQGLLRFRVRPYYLYQCDPIPGSAHFRTSVSRGLDIMQGLRGHTTGYAVPTYVIDAPGGGGKIALYPESVVGRNGDDLLLRNYEGKVFAYPDRDGCLAPRLSGPVPDPGGNGRCG